VLIKDNHIDAAGGITPAVLRVRSKWGKRFKIEVETRNLDEVSEALCAGVDRIMLDNMDNETMKRAVTLIGGRCETEASGNMTVGRLSSLADTGVDFVSFGELTHTVKVFDFSLKQESCE
jgi:nicotinate-nucleotide pyrophosphorylase (carboxylating)